MKGMYLSASTTALIFLSGNTTSLAQEKIAPEQNSGFSNPLAIQDIVVTARRRSEASQDVPVTITAVSGTELEQKGIRSVEDLRTLAPGVNVGGLRRDDAQFYIRGQGPGPITLGQHNFSSVATYFAEVPTTVGGPGVFYDLANVQVLKGPQGTLFGRNTTGGAVLFEPNRPEWRNGGYIELSYGNYDFKQFNGVVNASVVPDKIAIRIAAEVSRRNGYTRSIVTDQRLDDRRYEAFRGSLLLTPASGLENLTIVDYRSKDNNGGSEIIRAIDPTVNLGGTVGGNPMLAPLQALAPFAGLTSAQVGSIPITVGGGASIACLSAALPTCPSPFPLPPPYGNFGGVAAALASAYAGGGLALLAPTAQLNALLATQRAIGARQTQIASFLRSKQLDIGVTNKTIFDISDNLTLKNIVSMRWSRTNSSADFDGTPLDFIGNTYVRDQPWGIGTEQFTEEFQIQGKIPAVNVQYIAGYYHEFAKPGFIQQNQGFTANSFANRRSGYRDTSDAVFGHVEWDATSLIGISGGIRQTWDKREASLSALDAAGVCTQTDPVTNSCPISFKRNFSALSYDVTVNMKPMEGVLLYGTYRHGYKAGGINLPAPSGQEVFLPEKVDSAELGLKADWNVGIPFRTNIALFRDVYKDVQIQEQVTYIAGASTVSTSIVRNVARAINQGVEFQGSIAPIRDLTISGFFSYLDAQSKITIPNVIQAGRQLSNQPKWKYGVSGALVLPILRDEGKITLSADWSWQSEVNNSPWPSLVPTYPAYGVLNARLQWTDVFQKGVDLAAFANNLTNRTYILGGFPISALGFDSVMYGEPRMYGMSIKFRFGDR